MIWRNRQLYQGFDARLLLHQPMVRRRILIRRSRCRFPPYYRHSWSTSTRDLSKFIEDQTVHGFLPVPRLRQRRYYGTSTSSFPGPYSVPPGMTSITMEKASEVRKRSVSLSASQVSSMRLCFLVCVRLRLGWTGGCQPAVATEIFFLSNPVRTSRG